MAQQIGIYCIRNLVNNKVYIGQSVNIKEGELICHKDKHLEKGRRNMTLVGLGL